MRKLVGNLVAREHLGTSKQNMLEFSVKVDNDAVDSKTSALNLNKDSYDGMRRELAMMDLETLQRRKTVDREWQASKKRIGELQNLFPPVWRKSCKGIVAKPRLTRKIRDSIKFKEEA